MTPSDALAALETRGAVLYLDPTGAPRVRAPRQALADAADALAVLREHRDAVAKELRRREPATAGEDGACRRCHACRTFFRRPDGAELCVACYPPFPPTAPEGKPGKLRDHGYETETRSGGEPCPSCRSSLWRMTPVGLWLSPCGAYWTGHQARPSNWPDAWPAGTATPGPFLGPPPEELPPDACPTCRTRDFWTSKSTRTCRNCHAPAPGAEEETP